VPYRVLISRSAERELNSLPLPVRARIQEKILHLTEEPRPHGATKLEAQDLYRLRVGSYRVIYSISDKEHIAVILVVGHRSQVYR